jgi:hypothetical protein
MRRLWRHLRVAFVVLSALLSLVTWGLRVRSRTIGDKMQRTHARIQSDGAAIISYFGLWSGHEYIWLAVSSDRLGPAGRDSYRKVYFTDAKRSGGRAEWDFYDYPNADEYFLVDPFEGMTHRGPLRWGSWKHAEPELEFKRFSMTIAVQHWLVATLFAIAPAWAALAATMRWQRRQSRRKKGLCPECGYDVRATPDRCPECGFIATSIATSG